MKKSLVALATLSLISSAFAEESKDKKWYDVSSGYGSYEFSHKDKLISSGGENHDVQTLTVGARLQHGWSVEIATETERVDFQTSGTRKMEGLSQVAVGKSFKIEENNFLDDFTPYVKLAYGHKFKSTIDFAIFRYDLGTNYKLSDSLGLQLNWRHRQAFDSLVEDGTVTDYQTNETTLGFIYKFTPKDSIRFAKKIERADAGLNASSEYNTTSITYSRSF